MVAFAELMTKKLRPAYWSEPGIRSLNLKASKALLWGTLYMPGNSARGGLPVLIAK
ncbi:hypothetical protein D3C86_1877700 [compost metagenome]